MTKEIINNQEDSSKDNSKRRGKNVFSISIIILLLLIGAFLGWAVFEQKQMITDYQEDQDSLYTELDDINLLLNEHGHEIGQDVEANLQNMLKMYDRMANSYDKMEGSNQVMKDSINAQREQVKTLIAELGDAEKDKKYYVSKVYDLQEEARVLRSIMEDFVHTIDSLNAEQIILTESFEEAMNRLDIAQSNLNLVTAEKSKLEEIVNTGSKLYAYSFSSIGIKERGTGNFKETSRAQNSTHVRSCFTIGNNAIATPGDKDIYMRVITPEGTLLNNGYNNSFKTEDGRTLLYSDKKTINYQNENTDMCIFYELNGQDLNKGNYVAHIYADGVMIGSDNFVLK